jgi:homogentisate 1,2-dioxygenase
MCSDFSPLNPKVSVSPTQIAWRPFTLPDASTKVNFVQGMKAVAGSGSPMEKEGLAVLVYLANASMEREAYINNDGDMLIVPQQGRLDIQTELGHLMVAPGEICIIQRGLRFKVKLPDGPSRGYIQEVRFPFSCFFPVFPFLTILTRFSLQIYGSHYKLPELGPLGANGLANPRDFESPVASFEVDQGGWNITYKLMGTLWSCFQEHSPFDVVGTSPSLSIRLKAQADPVSSFLSTAWHGNYAPSKYDLAKFIAVGSVSRDHMDPSVCACSSFYSCPFPRSLFPSPLFSVAPIANVFSPPQTVSSPSTRRSPERLSLTSSSSALAGTLLPELVRFFFFVVLPPLSPRPFSSLLPTVAETLLPPHSPSSLLPPQRRFRGMSFLTCISSLARNTLTKEGRETGDGPC